MRGINVHSFESYLESDSLLADYYNEFLQLPCFSRILYHDPVTQQLSETQRSPPTPVRPPQAAPSRSNTVGTQVQRQTPATTLTENEDAVLESRNSKRAGADTNEQRVEIARLQDSVLRDWCLKHRVPLFLKSRQYRAYKLCRRLQRRATSRMCRSTATKSSLSVDTVEKPPTAAASVAELDTILNRRSAPTCLGERRISFALSSPQKKFSREDRPTSLPSVDRGRSIIPHLRKQVSLPSIPMEVEDKSFDCEPLTESPRPEEEQEEDLVDFEFFMGRKSILEFKEEIINFQYEDGISEVEFDEDYIATHRGMSEFSSFLCDQPHERDILELWFKIERYKDYLKEAKQIGREIEKTNRLKEIRDRNSNLEYKQTNIDAHPSQPNRTLEQADTTSDRVVVIKEEQTPRDWNDEDSVRNQSSRKKPSASILDAYLTEVTQLERLSLKQMRVQLLRTIQQLFNRQLTVEAWNTLRRSVHDTEATNEFIRHVQFDILTRLHGYWLQRFLLHCKKACGNLPELEARPGTSLTFYPSIRFERYLPLPKDAVTNALRRSVSSDESNVIKEGLGELTLEESILKTQEKSAIVSAFSSEVDAGCPFLTWLTRGWAERFEHERNLFRMWLEVDQLKKNMKTSYDRLLNVGSAWKIYQRYFNQDNYPLTSSTEKEIMYDKLTKYSEFTRDCALDLFGDAQKRAMDELEECWNEFRAEDNEDIVRNAYEKMLQDEQEKLVGSPNAERRMSRKQSKRISRQHAGKSVVSRVTRSAYSRALTSSPKKAVADDDNSSFASFDSDAPEQNITEQFLDHVDDTEMMEQFSLYIQRCEGRDALNQLNLFLEIDSYFLLSEQATIVKETTARGIQRTYFEEESRKHVDLPKHVVDEEGEERPSSRFFQEVQKHILPDLNDIYQEFEAERQEIIKAEEAKKILDQLELKAEEAVKLKKKNKEEKKKKKQAKALTVIEEEKNKKNELDRRTSVAKPSQAQKKKKVFGQTGGVALVTREDRHEWFNITSLYHEPSAKSKIEKFRKYLLHMHEGEGISGLEKDLQFYVEVVRFKDLHNSLDEAAIDKKVEVIVDVFLDSASPPWLQIDIPPEVASAAVQKASQYYSPVKKGRMSSVQLRDYDEKRKEARDSTIFDDAQGHVMKELLPYWAGFLRATALNKNGKERKITTAKVEKQHRLRYENFKKMEVVELPVFIRPPTAVAQAPTAATQPQVKVGETALETKQDETGEEAIEPRTQLHFSISEGHIWKEPKESKKNKKKRESQVDNTLQIPIISTAIKVN